MIKNFKDYQKKKKDLINHNKYYYDKSSPRIEDANYDMLKRQLIDFEEKNKIPKNEKKISDIVGFEPSKKFTKVKHYESMLSLDNAFDQNDIISTSI